MKCYKLVTQGLKAYGGFKYTLGKWTPMLGGAETLCNSGWYHVYDHPLLAMLLNPIHRNLAKPKLFECTYDGRLRGLDDQGLKRGVRRLRLDKELPLPVLTPNQCARLTIYCAKPICSEKHWRDWAKKWLNGKDRTPCSAIRVQRELGHGLRATCPAPVRIANRCALSAADVAKHVAGTQNLRGSDLSVYGYGARSTASAIKHAADFAKRITKPKAAYYWVWLIKKAIADENKLQEALAPGVKTC